MLTIGAIAGIDDIGVDLAIASLMFAGLLLAGLAHRILAHTLAEKLTLAIRLIQAGQR